MFVAPGVGSKNNIPLLAGARVSVQFKGKAIENVFKVPRIALRANNSVYLLDKENRLAKKSIETIWRDESSVWTRSLAVGDRLIVSPIALPVEGMRLNAAAQVKSAAQ